MDPGFTHDRPDTWRPLWWSSGRLYGDNHNISDSMETTPPPQPQNTTQTISKFVSVIFWEIWHASKVVHFCLVISRKHACKHALKQAYCVFTDGVWETYENVLLFRQGGASCALTLCVNILSFASSWTVGFHGEKLHKEWGRENYTMATASMATTMYFIITKLHKQLMWKALVTLQNAYKIHFSHLIA